MMKVFIVLVCAMLLFALSSCRKGNADPTQNTNQTPYAEQQDNESKDDSISEQQEIKMENNPIDRAFTRIADVRNEELKDNVTFAYLYALKWYDEFFEITKELLNMNTPETSWEIHLYSYKVMDIAFESAKKIVRSNNASSIFFEAARYYKMLTFEYLSPSDTLNIQANEEELYLFLSEVNYSEYIPDDYFDGFYMHEYSKDEHNPLPIYADLLDNNIHLAFAPPFGAVLSVNEEKYFFAWSNGYLTPRWVLPQLFLFDYNGDGKDELAVILYVGSGTGIAVTELHIVDIYNGMQDVKITYETIEELLYHRLSAIYDPVTQIVTVRLDNQAIEVDTSQVDKETRSDFRLLDLSSIIYFSEEKGCLKVHIAIGLSGFDWATPFDYVDFYADISLNERGYILLSNCYIEK